VRLLRPLLLIVALLFSQHAAMLHGLAHAEHEVALASHENDKAPKLGHGTDVCAAFGALAHALGDFAVASYAAFVPPAQASALAPAPAVAARIVFDSRAPPFSV
jgi:hypothetical protein